MNLIQTTIHPTPQSDHPDSVVEVDEPISNSSMFTPASILVELLKASALDPTSPFAQGMILEEQVPSIDLEKPSIDMSPPQGSNYPLELFTLNQ